MFSDKSRLIKGCFGLFFFFFHSLGSARMAGLLISSVGRGNWELPGHGASLTLSSGCKNVYQNRRDPFRF